ncbi:MAG: ribonuclease III domain-containing protein [Eubacteriales bacterium]|nr:ribonuclease III domain-containing protein [Eubacteriales bacterium]
MMSDLEGPVVLPDFGVKQYSPLTLAYIGDAVFELVIRTMLVREANTAVNKLHRRASGMVNAGAQSKMIGILEPYFTEEEASVYHRGRNAKAYTHAKNAGIQDYRRATGFEAVCGYLYLKKDWKRLLELIRIGLEGPEHEA